jgi:hypothetical protein
LSAIPVPAHRGQHVTVSAVDTGAVSVLSRSDTFVTQQPGIDE